MMSRRRFTVDEHQRMTDAGILGEDDRVELLEGEILAMAPIGPPAPPSSTVLRLFAARLGDRALVSVHISVRLGIDSEPQPHLALPRPKSDLHATHHPEPEHVLLVEVAMASVSFDRFVKLPLSAAGPYCASQAGQSRRPHRRDIPSCPGRCLSTAGRGVWRRPCHDRRVPRRCTYGIRDAGLTPASEPRPPHCKSMSPVGSWVSGPTRSERLVTVHLNAGAHVPPEVGSAPVVDSRAVEGTVSDSWARTRNVAGSSGNAGRRTRPRSRPT